MENDITLLAYPELIKELDMAQISYTLENWYVTYKAPRLWYELNPKY